MAISEQDLRTAIVSQEKGQIAIEIDSKPVASFSSGDTASIKEAAKTVAKILTK